MTYLTTTLTLESSSLVSLESVILLNLFYALPSFAPMPGQWQWHLSHLSDWTGIFHFHCYANYHHLWLNFSAYPSLLDALRGHYNQNWQKCFTYSKFALNFTCCSSVLQSHFINERTVYFVPGYSGSWRRRSAVKILHLVPHHNSQRR